MGAWTTELAIFGSALERAVCGVVALASIPVAGAAALRSEDWGCTQLHTAKLDENAIANAVDLYTLERGAMPETLEQLVPRYVREIHKDPWGAPYLYERDATGYSIISLGGGADPATLVHQPERVSTTLEERAR